MIRIGKTQVSQVGGGFVGRTTQRQARRCGIGASTS